MLKIIEEVKGVGCPHAKAPNGCTSKTYKCSCGAIVQDQCGNNALLDWHKRNCQ